MRDFDWARLHHHWYFWVAMVLMLAAIVNYVMTEDLTGLPRSPPSPPTQTMEK